MICQECYQFRGSHSHKAPYHNLLCTCDGGDKSGLVVMDAEVQTTIRVTDISTNLEELGGVYSGSEKPTFAPHLLERLRKLLERHPTN